ncbi:MAG TPA: EamA/RhaT family transporter [Thermotogae bacterium]|nr:EamA/RhaT family transporter [Thermotogota bacterium]
MNRLKPVFSLAGGVLLVSTAGLLIRISGGPPMKVAFYRVFFAFLIYTLVSGLFKLRIPYSLSFREIFLVVLAGVFLGLHFGFWVSAFGYTTVAGAVIPLSSQPIIVGVLGYLFYREKPERKILLPLFFIFTGLFVMFLMDMKIEISIGLGDILAFTGTVMVAFYFIVARLWVPRIGVLLFNMWTYGVATLVLLIGVLWGRFNLLPLRGVELLCYFLLAFGCSFLGYSLINNSLKHFRTVNVSLALVGEPALSILWAFLFLSEALTVAQFLGFVLCVFGLFLHFRQIR